MSDLTLFLKKKFFNAFRILVFLTSCSSSDLERNPYLPEFSFRFQVNLNLPEYDDLRYAGGSVLIPQLGHKGVLVFNLNGNIFFDQALFNLGKLGAADFTGNINNENKFSIFSFENNVFIDNKKKFFNKFGVYNKKKVPFNFFTSGSFDLTNLIFRINEVTTDVKIAEADVGVIQESFNTILLENGYETLFSFQSLKDFVKSISSD